MRDKIISIRVNTKLYNEFLNKPVKKQMVNLVFHSST